VQHHPVAATVTAAARRRSGHIYPLRAVRRAQGALQHLVMPTQVLVLAVKVRAATSMSVAALGAQAESSVPS
jgi:hypothetical protein